MSKNLVAVVALAVAAMANSAFAAEGVPSNAALSAMGLSGMQIMSDAEGMSVRGMGYVPHDSKKPWSAAFGVSYATVGTHGGSAGTLNGYAAEGKYLAGGENYSEAGKIKTHTTLLINGPSVTAEVKISTLKVFAGGSSSAYSF